MHGPDRLAQARDRLARWRAEHGGAGIRVPEAIWAEAVEVTRVEGIDAKAREARLRAVERRLVGHLRYLQRHDPLAHAALIRLLHRVVAADRAIQGGSTRPRVPVSR